VGVGVGRGGGGWDGVGLSGSLGDARGVSSCTSPPLSSTPPPPSPLFAHRHRDTKMGRAQLLKQVGDNTARLLDALTQIVEKREAGTRDS
jgi:hypothetical protein